MLSFVSSNPIYSLHICNFLVLLVSFYITPGFNATLWYYTLYFGVGWGVGVAGGGMRVVWWGGGGGVVLGGGGGGAGGGFTNPQNSKIALNEKINLLILLVSFYIKPGFNATLWYYAQHFGFLLRTPRIVELLCMKIIIQSKMYRNRFIKFYISFEWK